MELACQTLARMSRERRQENTGRADELLARLQDHDNGNSER